MRLCKLYVESDEEISSIIRKAVLRVGSEDLLLKKVRQLYNIDYSKRLFTEWFNKNWFPFEIIKTSSFLLGLDCWDILNNKKIRGSCGNSILFKKEITPELSNLFGWILTDGYLSKDSNQIGITQNDITVLKRLGKTFKDYFNLNHSSITIREINKDIGFKNSKKCFVLTINSHAIKQILLDYYGFLSGKLKKTRIPSCILKSNENIKKSFLAGCLEGDGNIYLIDKKKARLMITCKSKSLAYQLKNIFEDLYGRTRILYHTAKRCYILQICSSETIAKIIVDFRKYIIHPNRIKNIEHILKCDKFLRKLRVPVDSKYKKYLINKAINKIEGKQKMEKYKILANLLSKQVNFDVKPMTIYSCWQYTWPSIPLMAFKELCKLSNEDFTQSTPLWLKEFLRIRESSELK